MKQVSKNICFRTLTYYVVFSMFFLSNFFFNAQKIVQPEFVPVTEAPDDVSHFDPDFTNLTPGRFVPPIGSVTVATDPEFPSFDYNHHSLPDTG